MNWSYQQIQALDKVSRWLQNSNSQVFYLAGYAGTGKTTLARYFVEGFDGTCLQAAYTGKAASVLRKSGFPGATTLHSILYRVQDNDRSHLQELILAHKIAVGQEDQVEAIRLEAEIRKERELMKGPRFYLNPDSPLASASLLVVDEVSMVSKDLGMDILSFGKKVLVLGDPAQLPPIRGAGFFTGREPDHLLTEIHRQAAENPIIRWSQIVREGGVLPFKDEGEARKIRKQKLRTSDLPHFEQILCGKNRTRRRINQSVRRSLGHNNVFPQKGDRLVVLRNDRELGVLNGVLCTAAEDVFEDEDGWYGLMINYEGYSEPIMVDMDPGPFQAYTLPEEEREEFVDRTLLQLDFGYALTVHKSQGSQWEDVLIADDGFGVWNQALRRQWLYTGITRAERTLTIAS